MSESAAAYARSVLRPGAEKRKSLAKSLGPKGQKAVKAAIRATKDGNPLRAAAIYREIALNLEADKRVGLAGRAMLRCARNLHLADKPKKAEAAVEEAIKLAAQSPRKKEILKHVKVFVGKLRSGGRNELADRVESEVLKAFGRQRLARKRK